MVLGNKFDDGAQRKLFSFLFLLIDQDACSWRSIRSCLEEEALLLMG